MAIEVGTAFVTIIPSAKGFAKNLQGEMASEFRSALGFIPDEGTRAGRTFSERFRNSISSGLANLGGILRTGLVTAGTGIVAGLGLLTAFGLKSAATLEQTRISFNSLAGSVEKGGKVFKQLQDFAAVTPFEFTDLTKSAGRFLAFADSVKISRDQLVPFLTTIGNVVSVTGGTAENLDSVTLALGQIASRGKVTLDNINQLSNALPGFSGVAALAAARGQTTAQVMDAIQAGTINAEDGVKQLLAGMQKFPGAAGAMEQQSKTLLGVFSTFKDVIGQALAGAFAPAIPAIKDALTQITPVIGDALNTLAPALGSLLAALLPLVGQIVTALTPILTPLINALGPALATLGPALAPLGDALGQIATVLAPVLPLFAELISAVVTGLSPVIKALAPVINGLIFGLGAAIRPLLPVIVQLGTILGAILLPISQALGQVFVALGPVIGEIAVAFGQALMPLLVALAPLVTQLLEAFLPLLPIFATLAPPLIQLVVALTPLIVILADLLTILVQIIAPVIAFTSTISALLASKAVVPIIEALATALGFILKPLGFLIKPLGDLIDLLSGGSGGKSISDFTSRLKSLGKILSSVGTFFADLGKTIASGFVTAFKATVQFFKDLPGNLVAGLKALPGLLVSIIQDAGHKIFFAIGFAIGTIIKLAIAIPKIVGDLFKAGWQLSVQVTVDAFNAVIDFFKALPGRLLAIIKSLWSFAVAEFKAGVKLVTDVVKAIPGFFADLWADVKKKFLDGIDAAIKIFKEFPGKAKAQALDTIKSIKDAFLSIGEDMIKIGKNIIDSLASGIKGAVKGAVDAAKGAIHDIIDGAKKALLSGSPSKIFVGMGANTMDSFALGVNDKASVAQQAVANALTPDLATLNGLAQAAGMATLEPITRSTTLQIYPQRADLSRDDLEAVLDREDALARVGRPG